MKSTLKNMVLVLFTITAISAALVALVNDVTKETIALTEQKNRDLAKLEVLPSFSGEPTLNEQSYELGEFKVNVSEVVADGNVIGYAVEAPSITWNGYADRIYLMVGFVEEADSVRINGVKVLSQKETPGIGANMIKPGNKLERSILNKNADKLVFEVKKENPNGSFDALTGSTISSRAYANAVETAYAGYLMYKGLLLPQEPATEEPMYEESELESEMSEESELEVSVDMELGEDASLVKVDSTRDEQGVVTDENSAEIGSEIPTEKSTDEPAEQLVEETSQDDTDDNANDELVAQEGEDK